MTEDFVASAKWLKARPESNGKLGAVGFCFGGGIVNQLAVRLGRISARARRSTAASRAPRTRRRSRRRWRSTTPATIRASTPASRRSRRRSRRTTRRTDVYIYDGAQHGFHNDTTPRYDEAAAKLAWQRTLDLFNKNLR